MTLLVSQMPFFPKFNIIATITIGNFNEEDIKYISKAACMGTIALIHEEKKLNTN